MKKLLIIFSFFFCSFIAYAEDINVKKKIKFPKDIVKGYKNEIK